MLSASIVIPVFGRQKYLTACLAALAAHTGPHELVLVDNGTGYDAQADVIIRNDLNLGFAHACNQGARAAHSDAIVFLNVDTEVQPDWLPPLLAPLADDLRIGATGARLTYPDGRVQHAGIEFYDHQGDIAARNIHDDLPTRYVQGVTGACLAVLVDVFEEVGGFDEGYWNGYDDVDLCLKVRAAGWRIRYVAESHVMHHESVTGHKARWSKVEENCARLQEKWAGHPIVR